MELELKEDARRGSSRKELFDITIQSTDEALIARTRARAWSRQLKYPESCMNYVWRAMVYNNQLSKSAFLREERSNRSCRCNEIISNIIYVVC